MLRLLNTMLYQHPMHSLCPGRCTDVLDTVGGAERAKRAELGSDPPFTGVIVGACDQTDMTSNIAVQRAQRTLASAQFLTVMPQQSRGLRYGAR